MAHHLKREIAVTLADFEVAIERSGAGLEKHSRIISEPERRRVAGHEMAEATQREIDVAVRGLIAAADHPEGFAPLRRADAEIGTAAHAA